ncbi:energy-coupling factor transport system permease protein [Paenibacillus cellulosilyticus]|uniref:Energy-coupling factor transport system permease protein n=1 Tax=Paenibacillus cellulosilyticus TaxID=375489 RepID=A0A2V2YX44_9BACL|nr:energy-coupling factor transporter transmembrane component T [Paenibacillus cellulosilyticus]PWW04758.1 energy-coupling factor transport system permease protein [Paenibacillus cellulosilyticus]QKS45882.1 energy-coupling factor transporter transmembrane protein EcfT [Paenibacillus cellulosilyticus]
MRRDSFAAYHPIVNFGYFVVVLAFSMIFMHPVFQGIALISAVTYSIVLNGIKAIRFNVLYMLPMLIILAAANPLFNHAGVTILFYMKDGNPVTLESILYGIASSCMLITVMVWFSCYNKVMTSDKFIYLFGRIIPALSLIFSMVLRFVPRFKQQIRVISVAQRSIGRDVTQGNVVHRARHGIRILSIMTTWAMENAIETADSMKARGYGLPGRTSFSLYRLDRRDQTMLITLAILIAAVLIGASAGENTIRYFPSIHMKDQSWLSAVVYTAYGLLCMLPAIISLVEELKWKFIISKT